MSGPIENTFTAYLGSEFQQKLMWQLLVEPEFAEKTIPDLAVEYFDDPILKRLFIIILEYFKEYEKVPNLQNQSIHQAINAYKTPNNIIEEESLFAVVKRLELWNERMINKQMLHDGDIVQKATNAFIKQQEYRKLAESILDKVKNGSIRNKNEIIYIEDKFLRISHIGEEEDNAEEITEGIDKALRKEFRQTIPTGVEFIDALTGGGLGRGEIGVVLTPSGVGKTTLLTKIANTAYEQEKNIAQIIFEDTSDQIKRKHYTIWAKSALSKLDDEVENDRVNAIAHEHVEALKGKGRLVIKRFSQENTTMVDIRNWMLSYQKKHGFKFDMIVLDYLDCLEPHRKVSDRNEAELQIIKSFEALASDFDIPGWTAIQSNRSGFGAEFVEAQQIGGNIKRLQKAHFFMSVAKTQQQQESNLANIRILKARFAKDGHAFNDCIFNNDTLEIRLEDSRYKFNAYKKLKHGDSEDVEKMEDKLAKMTEKSTDINIHTAINKYIENNLIDMINDESINDVGDKTDKYKELLDKFMTEKNGGNVNEGVSEGVNEGVNKTIELPKTDDILELADENDVISNTIEGVSEGVNEGVSTESSFEWNGESGTTENEIVNQSEVKIDDIPKIQPKIEPQINVVATKMPEELLKKPIIREKVDVSEIEKLLISDPDEEERKGNLINNLLSEKRKNQNVVKKE